MTNISSQLQSMIWSQLWQVTLLVVVVGLVAVTTLRRRPHVAYLLWALVFVKCLMPPMWSSPTGVFSWLQASPYSFSGTLDSALPGRAEGIAKRMLLERQLAKSEDATRAEDTLAHPSASVDAEPGWEAAVTTVTGFALTTWIAGACLLLALALLRIPRMVSTLEAEGCRADPGLEAALQRLALQLGVRKQVRLRVSSTNNGPLVFGFRHPLIVLPEIMVQAKTIEQLEPILAHELIHVRRGDTVLSVLQFLAQVIWWFHPLVWWASRQVNRACERCCDAEVIASLNYRPRDYANSLLDVLEFKSQLRPGIAMPGVRAVDITKSRVTYIMNESRHFRARPAKIYWLLAIALALLILPGGALLWGSHAYTPGHAHNPMARLRDQARVALQQRDWCTAASVLNKVVENEPHDARSWFLMGYALHVNGNLDEAIVAHRRATNFPSTRVLALYNLSCAYALKGDIETALKHLEASLDAGYVSAIPVSQDADFSSLVGNDKFQELAQRAMPVASRDVYRQLDFWVGDWEVRMKSGEPLGCNVITIDVNGFLLTEKWINPYGGTGSSISFYDPGERKWKQTWVDQRGTVVRYTGSLDQGEMRMEGKRTLANGQQMHCRKRYIPQSDGTVRQVNECSEDGGKTWSVYFDGFYHRLQTTRDGVSA